mmetsp:Transcript_35370/g.82705  ORF Transcript_35370/g.82705 Transcript_35370/m.82705 type:complete len:200 (+) Transcript_35370:752-1351(+)
MLSAARRLLFEFKRHENSLSDGCSRELQLMAAKAVQSVIVSSPLPSMLLQLRRRRGKQTLGLSGLNERNRVEFWRRSCKASQNMQLLRGVTPSHHRRSSSNMLCSTPCQSGAAHTLRCHRTRSVPLHRSRTLMTLLWRLPRCVRCLKSRRWAPRRSRSLSKYVRTCSIASTWQRAKCTWTLAWGAKRGTLMFLPSWRVA